MTNVAHMNFTQIEEAIGLALIAARLAASQQDDHWYAEAHRKLNSLITARNALTRPAAKGTP